MSLTVARLRLGRAAAPYALLAPAMLVMAAVLAYPLYFLVRLSLERYGLSELIAHDGAWTGLRNYEALLRDSLFWQVVARTIAFTAVNVALTMGLGTLVALLLVRLGSAMRLLITGALVLAWAMPVVVAVQVWTWMVSPDNGVVNHLLAALHLGDFAGHDWFASSFQGFAVIGALIVWGAIPFVAITLYAGLAQVPADLVEAASIDGAGPWRVFRDVTFPLLKPLFVILTSLSIFWDFQVFTQPFLMRFQRPNTEYFLMSIYSYQRSFGVSEYGLGAAIVVAMVAMLLAVSLFYVRQMVKLGDVR